MILSAIVVLVVGYIVGRLLEAVVVRILEGIGLSDYTGGTALESSGEGGGLERALGKIAAYYVYFIAILAADVLQIPILSQLLQQIGAFIPVVISAIVILVLGFIVGRVIRDIIADLIGGFNLGRYLRDTPLGRSADQEGEFGNIVGTLVAYYVYFLTLVTAANVLQIGVLSGLLSRFAGHLPTLIGGLAVLIAGILIADFVGGLVASTDGRWLTDIFGVAVKIFIYYMTATLTLNTIGFATDVLTNLLTSSSWRCSVRSGSRSRSASVSASASELAGTSPRTSTTGPHGPAIRSPTNREADRGVGLRYPIGRLSEAIRSARPADLTALPRSATDRSERSWTRTNCSRTRIGRVRSPTIHYDEGDPSDRIEPWSERQQLWEASVAYRAWQHARSPNRSRRAG